MASKIVTTIEDLLIVLTNAIVNENWIVAERAARLIAEESLKRQNA